MIKLRSTSLRITIKGLIGEYFLTNNIWGDKLGIFQNRYQEGNGLLNLIKDGVIILGIGGVGSGFIDLSKIPYFIYPILAIMWYLLCYTLGYLSEKFGWWKNRAKHTSGTIDPILSETHDNVNKIFAILNKDE